MTGDDIRALRKELGLTQRQLSEALKIDVELVRGWEREEHFATKSHCDAMEALRKSGGPALKAQKPVRPPTVLALLSDPSFFTLLRKLLSHPKLRAESYKLAEGYPDPVDDPDV